MADMTDRQVDIQIDRYTDTKIQTNMYSVCVKINDKLNNQESYKYKEI